MNEFEEPDLTVRLRDMAGGNECHLAYLVQVQSIDQPNRTYFTSDGGVLGFDEVSMDDVLLASEVEG